MLAPQSSPAESAWAVSPGLGPGSVLSEECMKHASPPSDVTRAFFENVSSESKNTPI